MSTTTTTATTTTTTSKPSTSPAPGNGTTQSMTISSFTISTRKLPILNSQGIDAMTSQLGFTPPEMIFGSNEVKIVDEQTGWQVAFNALDALELVDKTGEGGAMLKVSYASEWSRMREKAIKEGIKEVVRPFDWSYTTSYRGTVGVGASSPSRAREVYREDVHADGGGESGGGNGKEQIDSEIEETEALEDGKKEKKEALKATNIRSESISISTSVSESSYITSTKSTTTDTNPIQSSLPSTSSDHTSSSSKNSSIPPHHPQPHSSIFQPTQTPIPISKLRLPDPILFFDEVLLYEDELADNGISLLSVKIRVMPARLLLLSRFFLRLDGVVYRIRDTRVYIEFETREVIREYTEREGSYADVAKKIAHYAKEDIPGIIRDSNVISELLPVLKLERESAVLK